MGMYDYFEPDPPLSCPACKKLLTEWQGKDGPCALLVWRQGRAAPIEQRVPDEVKVDATAQFRLPKEFTIYTECCGKKSSETATGRCERAVWVLTILESSKKSK